MVRWVGDVEFRVLYSRAGVASQFLLRRNWSVLVDCGDGVVRDLLEIGFDFSSLRVVLVTHGHYDHVGGFFSLLGFLRMMGRREPLYICFPDGCGELLGLVDLFLSVYGDTVPFKIVLRGLRGSGEFVLDKLRVLALDVFHGGGVRGLGLLGRIPALGYRVYWGDVVFAFTGDTGVCSSLFDLVRGVDLAIIEATHGFEGDLKYHLSVGFARRLRSLARDFILVHRRS